MTGSISAGNAIKLAPCVKPLSFVFVAAFLSSDSFNPKPLNTKIVATAYFPTNFSQAWPGPGLKPATATDATMPQTKKLRSTKAVMRRGSGFVVSTAAPPPCSFTVARGRARESAQLCGTAASSARRAVVCMLVTSALSLLAVQLGSLCSRVCVQPTATHSSSGAPITVVWCKRLRPVALCLIVTPYRTALRLKAAAS